jgi:hypothetical protein
MTTPDPPAGYSSFEQYSLPRWILTGAMIFLILIAAVPIFTEGIVLFPESNIELVVGVGIAISSSLFLHESLHYLANSKLGYDPVYLWPNKVYVPKENLELWESTMVLLAPQMLSVLYVAFLFMGSSPALELVVGWGLVLNLGGAASDVSWVIRRITWPEGTMVVVGDDHENYASFPKNSL